MRIMDISEFDPDFDPFKQIDPQLDPYSDYVQSAILAELSSGLPCAIEFPDGSVCTLVLGPDGQVVDQQPGA